MLKQLTVWVLNLFSSYTVTVISISLRNIKDTITVTIPGLYLTNRAIKACIFSESVKQSIISQILDYGYTVKDLDKIYILAYHLVITGNNKLIFEYYNKPNKESNDIPKQAS